MNEQLNEALIQLEKDLSKIRSANDQLLESGKISLEMTETFTGALDHIKDQMQSIEKVFNSLADDYRSSAKENLSAINDANSKWSASLKSSTEDLFAHYKSLWKKHNEEVKQLIQEHEALSSKTAELVSYLNSVNFPARLDKIDSSISANNTSIQNFYQQVDGIKSDLRNDLNRVEQSNTGKFTIAFVLIAIAIIIQIVHFFI